MALSRVVLSWRPKQGLLEPLTWLRDPCTTCTAKWPETRFKKTKRKEQAPIWREVAQRTHSALSVTDLLRLHMCLLFTSQELSEAGAEIATVILVRKTKAIFVALLSLTWRRGLRWPCHLIWRLQQHPKSKLMKTTSKLLGVRALTQSSDKRRRSSASLTCTSSRWCRARKFNKRWRTKPISWWLSNMKISKNTSQNSSQKIKVLMQTISKRAIKFRLKIWIQVLVSSNRYLSLKLLTCSSRMSNISYSNTRCNKTLTSRTITTLSLRCMKTKIHQTPLKTTLGIIKRLLIG